MGQCGNREDQRRTEVILRDALKKEQQSSNYSRGELWDGAWHSSRLGWESRMPKRISKQDQQKEGEGDKGLGI